MTAPALEVLAAAQAAALKDARDSDLSALRTMHRHLAILAEDYRTVDLDTSYDLDHACNWVELAINHLVDFRKKEERTP